ncbi:bacterial Ig-like domain-containing protein [Eubacterium sp. 1001713B170207_170306_E7]|uniref:bacterial Ig-like domain-containing protein n=1 Tax=Eubacterium sp. 1001713B170207_170306_E7 TaxID=2787097 RepID=UPI00189C2E5C|nr:bacterial Ig-like domain-containing protein [Eubacterium sp. 1001713B170207_170306_E7]
MKNKVLSKYLAVCIALLVLFGMVACCMPNMARAQENDRSGTPVIKMYGLGKTQANCLRWRDGNFLFAREADGDEFTTYFSESPITNENPGEKVSNEFLTNLKPGTTYYAVAKDLYKGESYTTEQISFRTLDADTPVILTLSENFLGADSLGVKMNINTIPSDYHNDKIYYSDRPISKDNHGDKQVYLGAGDTDLIGRYSRGSVKGLLPNTTYYFIGTTVIDGVEYWSEPIEIKTLEKNIESISIKKLPTKTEYVEGTEFDPSGGILSITYEGGDVQDVKLDAEGVVCNVDMNQVADEVPVTVLYNGRKTNFNIKIMAKVLESIDISKQPQNEYFVGNSLNLEDGELTLAYNNGTTDTLAMNEKDVTVTGYDKDKTGEQTLTVTYGEKSTEWKVTVVSKVAVEKVIDMINKIDLENLYESDRKTVYNAKGAYDKLETQLEKNAVTNIEVLNKAVALFEAPFHSEDIVNNVTITADGKANILPLKTRLTAKISLIENNQKQAVLVSFKNNPSMIGSYDLSYAYPEKNGKDYEAALTEGSQVHYSIPLNPSLVGNRAVNVVYINTKGEINILKSEYKEGILTFDSGKTGTFAFVLTDVPAPVDPVNPENGGSNTTNSVTIKNSNPLTAIFSAQNGALSIAVGLGILIVAGAAAYAAKKKHI